MGSNYTFPQPILEQDDFWYDQGTGAFQSVAQGINLALVATGSYLGASLPVPDTYFANNPLLASGSTAGLFWTAADAAASGYPNPTVNADALLEIARAYSAANGAEILFRGVNYTLNTTHNTFVGGERMRGDPGGNTWFLVNFAVQGAKAPFGSINNMNTWIEDVQLRWINCKPIRSIFQDYLTGLFLTDPNIETCVTMGDWTGLTVYGPMIASATRPSLANGTIINIDVLPLGYANVAAANAALLGATVLTPKIGIGCTIISPGFQNASDGAGSYFTVTVSLALVHDLPGAIPAQPFVPASSTSPEVWPYPAIPAVTMYLTSGSPFYYKANHFSFLCNDLVLDDCTSQGSGSNSFLIGGKGYGRRVKVNAPTTHPDTAGPRYVGSNLPGGCFIAEDWDIQSNDDAAQAVPGAAYSAQGFSATSNLDCTIFYNGGRFISLGGRAANATVEVPNGNQHAAWATTNGLAVGNTLLLPLANIPSGLTVAQLQASAALYLAGNDYSSYSVGYKVSNPYNNNIYSLVTPGVSDAGGNGPTGTGSHIVDGTCVWSYVQAGVTQQVYYGQATGVIAPLAYVLPGTTSDGTTVTIPIAAPGVTNAIEMAVAAGPSINVNFVVGIPPVIFTNSVICKITGAFLRTYAEIGALVQGSDTQGTCRMELSQCLMDNRFGFQSNPSIKGALGLSGGTINTGGSSMSVSQCIIYGPSTSGINTNGNCPRFDIDHTYFYPIRNTTQPWAPYVFAGVQAGTVSNCTLWAQPAGATNPGESFTLGQAPTTNFGINVNNNAQNITFRDNMLLGIVDNLPFFKIDYAAFALDFENNTFIQATALGSGNGKGITLLSTITAGTVVTSGNNKFDQIDGPPYAGTLSFLTIISNDVQNPAPNPAGANYPFTVPTTTVAFSSVLTANSPTSFSSGVYTLPSSNSPVVTLNLKQNPTVASGTITLPAGYQDGQLIFLRSNSQVTSLNFAGATCSWTNGTTLAANTGIILMWDAAATEWRLASQP